MVDKITSNLKLNIYLQGTCEAKHVITSSGMCHVSLSFTVSICPLIKSLSVPGKTVTS